jgi:hypothetical protein
MKWSITKTVCLMISIVIFAIMTFGMPQSHKSKHSAVRITSPDVSSKAGEIIGFHLILK